MNNCIVCHESLSTIEKDLNMNFHSICTPNVIKLAWDLLTDSLGESKL